MTMKGLQYLYPNRSFTLDELAEFMKIHWDTLNYNNFIVGKPTSLAAGQAIILPATARHVVLVVPHLAGELFNRKDKIILSVTENQEGFEENLISSLVTNNAFTGIWSIQKTMSIHKERKGPAEESLLRYTEHLRTLLKSEGCLD